MAMRRPVATPARNLPSQLSLLAFVVVCFTVQLSIRSGVTGFIPVIASLALVLVMHGGAGLQARWTVPMYLTSLFVVTTAALFPSDSTASPLPTMAVVAAILPMATTIGYALSRDPLMWQRFMRTYVRIALIMAALATYEHVRVSRILGSTEQADLDRALVFVQHPIVLGLLLAIGIPFTPCLKRRAVRLASVLLLLAGVYSTGSSGPMAVSGALTVLTLAPSLTHWFARRPGLLKVALFCAVVVTAWLSIYHWTNVINDSTTEEYSTAYRPALYSLVPEMLAGSPLGHGFSGLPQGVLFIFSNARGVSDVSISIDAEPVLLASKFGYLGLVVYVVWIIIAINGLRNARTASLAAMGLLGCGFVVALTTWPQIAALLFMTLAFAYSSRRGSEGHDDGASVEARP
ncbi:hypothetical protein ASG94_13045 [Nocardioides sp. Soil805]|nr:hypothetical protein ASG94_13045 [Nocardioides sp. Soil805]